ncbi:hypothetical protein S7711_09416 [Stachybotrys chartarum IBT 7711]|uniref:Uncharacterized protein n=1 Tax=Stachybotrys chartarum (strain CBS 109288 / IBT 7711) TaxID=1280523 RepID=A0A084AL72_STACB|nr:hypothetical protein S7711_09416 [Stachybotrys chartarum IBT 7711]KFA54218.1 hypothetical protein S40293_08143 [Stachybotrys chartarum IBT 40293]
MGFDLYVFQDRETIIQLLRHPTLASPMSLYVFGMRLLFGMPQKGVESYIQDDSGPSVKPFPGSNVAPEKRVDYMLHKAFNQAWAGRSMTAASQRFMKLLDSHMDSWDIPESGTDVDDFFKFIGRAVSSSVTETVFGPALLKLNPDLIENAWAFDNDLPWMFRQVPAFLMPRPYRLRKKMCLQIRRWYAYARQWFTEASIYPDGDGDPFWGSEIIRHLQKELLRNGNRGFIDDESFAAHDLGLIWGSNSNVIAAATLAAFHIFRDPILLQRVRTEIDERFDQPVSLGSIGFKEIWDLPLLASIHAEILRLYVDVLLIFSSPHEDALLGRWRLPRGKKALVSTYIAHRDEKTWNTKDGLHPLDTFWADRFIVNPLDLSTGPLKDRKTVHHNREQDGKPYFSTEGLDGLWIPFGGK